MKNISPLPGISGAPACPPARLPAAHKETATPGILVLVPRTALPHRSALLIPRRCPFPLVRCFGLHYSTCEAPSRMHTAGWNPTPLINWNLSPCAAQTAGQNCLSRSTAKPLRRSTGCLPRLRCPITCAVPSRYHNIEDIEYRHCPAARRRPALADDVPTGVCVASISGPLECAAGRRNEFAAGRRPRHDAPATHAPSHQRGTCLR
jgi:hypothetical protein